MNIKTALTLALLLQSLLVSRALASAADHRLDIYWIDSEGGGSTLIVTPTDESILIDTGNPGGRDFKRIHETATKTAGPKENNHFVGTTFSTHPVPGAVAGPLFDPVDHPSHKGSME